jgi:hypothetical protein
MVRLSIEISEDLNARVETRAAQSGHPSVEEFVRSLLEEEVESGPLLSDAEILEKLRETENDGPPIKVTPEYWQRKREQLAQRLGQNGRE